MTEEVLSEEVYERFLSGMGLAAYILYKNIPPGADPLGPDNILGFVPGLLTGTGSLFTGRWMVVGKSPLTGTWGEANCGGTFSPAIKQCGYDGIFFKGISEKPVYLYADHGKAELRDASGLWGKDTVETVEILTKDTNGKKPCVACIGPAGERLSLISGISNDKGRMAARSGLGAVMGSKNLKAVVLAGSKRIIPHDKEEMHRLSKNCNKSVQFKIPFPLLWLISKIAGTLMRLFPFQIAMDGMLYKFLLQKWGTTGMNRICIEMGDSPIKNWKGSYVDLGPRGLTLVDPDLFENTVKMKYHCYSCPLGCGGICDTKGKDPLHKPEYETVLALGGLLMNKNIESIFSINDLLNRAGMDTISAGGTAAFAIESFEKGVLTKEDTDGLELKWGNTEALIKLFEKMVASARNRKSPRRWFKDCRRIRLERIQSSLQFRPEDKKPPCMMEDGTQDLHFTAVWSLHQEGIPWAPSFIMKCSSYGKKSKACPRPRLFTHKDTKYVANKEKAVQATACSCYTQLFNSAGLCMFGAFLGA